MLEENANQKMLGFSRCYSYFSGLPNYLQDSRSYFICTGRVSTPDSDCKKMI